MRSSFSESLRLLVSVLIVAGSIVTAQAQFKASIQGTVTDASGAVVSGATITVTNAETGRSQQVITGDDGFYRASGLAPGNYTVSVEVAGFKKKVIENVLVGAEEPRGVNVT
ncbi:MAG TPA: carboxypeptidase-like regulatory domain-containing protein, partial [Blastocatellia bacterium]|nr:carboxypeptidase-like regulatory domain-containing protein [Blastocatellia bacterium]